MALCAAAFAGEPPPWAYPACPSGAPQAPDASRPESVPGSTRQFTAAAIADWSVASDWFPEEHSPLPTRLATSQDTRTPACVYCHLPSGGGRPENAVLAGLPAAYIVAQVRAFQAHERGAANAWPPSVFMAKVAADLGDDDLAAAAEYFSGQRATPRIEVIESRTVPGYAATCFVFAPTGTSAVPLGSAIVELPTDRRQFELRNPHAKFKAYVPPGSIGRGRRLAQSGGGRTQPCGTCHGVHLEGRDHSGPPLAGRFTGYLFRQMYGFQSGARGAAAGNPMPAVVAELTQSDMIDLAAYATSLPP